MADNITLDAGSGGDTIAADDITSVKYQRVKIVLGADGVNDGDVESGNPMPVEGPVAEDGAVGGNPLLAGGRYDSVARTLDDGDVGAIAIDADGAVQISDGGNTITVDGTITANAGTNLNTSTLALEAGGNLATVAGAVSGSEMQVDVVAALPAGTNAIGKLAANSGVDIGDVDVTSMPALDRTTDNMGAACVTDAVMQDTTARTPVFATISGNTNGNNTLVAAQGAGNKIRVLSMVLCAHGDVTVTIEDGAAGSDLALFEFDGVTQPKGVAYQFSPVGHFETSANTLLNMALDAAVYVTGSLVYIVVT